MAAVALSMARLGVLDEAEARLASLRQRQRAMVDTLMAQLRAQREGLRCALNDVAPGLDGHNGDGGAAAALSSALDAAAAAQAAAERECVMETEAQQGWRAALAWAKGQLPGVLAGALGACCVLRFRWCAFGGCLLTPVRVFARPAGVVAVAAVRRTAARVGADRAAARAAALTAEDGAAADDTRRAAAARAARRPATEHIDPASVRCAPHSLSL